MEAKEAWADWLGLSAIFGIHSCMLLGQSYTLPGPHPDLSHL